MLAQRRRHRAFTIPFVSATALLFSAACNGPEAPDPPGGGQVLELDFDTFATNVEPILTSYGCDSRNCHGGGIRGTFELSPSDEKDVAFDFEQASLQVSAYDREHSPLLVKPLKEDGGIAPHSFEPFETTDDPSYQAILAWILAGELR
jgi:hypothetical protein